MRGEREKGDIEIGRDREVEGREGYTSYTQPTSRSCLHSLFPNPLLVARNSSCNKWFI